MKMIKTGAGNNKGFTLLELSVALAGLAIITTAAIPYFIRQAEVAAAQRTTKEVSSIQEAAKWYRVQNSAWPTSVATLQTAGYLNPSWSAQNPWGNAYAISANATSLTVTTILPDSMGGVLSRALPGVSWTTVGSNRTINSAIPVPGQEASLTGVTNLANNAQSTANSAQSSANSAQSTASSAQSAANSAQSSASSAQTTANSAQGTANNALSTANSAQSTANSALSLAQGSAVPPYGTLVITWGGGDDVWTCPAGYVVTGVGVSESSNFRTIACQRISR